MSVFLELARFENTGVMVKTWYMGYCHPSHIGNPYYGCVYIYIYMYLLIDRWPNPFVGKIVYVLTMAHMKQMDTNGSLPQNGATPKSSMFIRFPIINHQSWGIPHFKKLPNTYKYIKHLAPPWTSNTAWVPLTWTVAGRCFLDCVVSVPRLGTESWGCLVGYLRSCILLVGG